MPEETDRNSQAKEGSGPTVPLPQRLVDRPLPDSPFDAAANHSEPPPRPQTAAAARPGSAAAMAGDHQFRRAAEKAAHPRPSRGIRTICVTWPQFSAGGGLTEGPHAPMAVTANSRGA